MNGSSQLRSRDWRALIQLWGEVAEEGALDVERGVRHLMGGLSTLTGETVPGFAMVTTRPAAPQSDPLGGWRLTEHLVLRPSDTRFERLLAEWLADPRNIRESVPPRRLARRAGRRRLVLEDEALRRRFPRSPSWALADAVGVRERVVGVLPVVPRVEVYFGFERNRACFSERDLQLIGAGLEGGQGLAARLARRRGLVGPLVSLSPRERQVARALLSAHGEKELAARLNLTVRSLHQVVVSVYRKLGVHSRPELVARVTELGTPGAAEGNGRAALPPLEPTRRRARGARE